VTAKKRILIVDDEPTAAIGLQTYLQQIGPYEVRVETHGLQVFSIAKEFKPDLILLDIVMPDMDGSSVGEELQTDEELKKIPIIFLTGILSEEEVIVQGRSIGGYPFLAKPVTPEMVLTHIQKTLGT